MRGPALPVLDDLVHDAIRDGRCRLAAVRLDQDSAGARGSSSHRPVVADAAEADAVTLHDGRVQAVKVHRHDCLPRLVVEPGVRVDDEASPVAPGPLRLLRGCRGRVPAPQELRDRLAPLVPDTRHDGTTGGATIPQRGQRRVLDPVRVREGRVAPGPLDQNIRLAKLVVVDVDALAVVRPGEAGESPGLLRFRN